MGSWGVGVGGGGARVSQFFCTTNPNIKEEKKSESDFLTKNPTRKI